MTTITLIPLDDRPATRAIPQEVAAIAGVDVETPPLELRPRCRVAPEPEAVSAWFRASRARTDAAVVSLDALGFGGLIGSRIGDERLEDVLANWSPLTEAGGPVHAAIVIPRTPNSLDAMEEPPYWTSHGPSLHALSARLASTEDDLAAARAAVAPAVPDAVAQDWTGRRLRQHTLALAALGMAQRGTLDTLVVGVDDAALASLSARAQSDLHRWSQIVGATDRVMVHPGADEIGSVLVARAIGAHLGVAGPTVAIRCADADGLDRPAPYETGPVRLTVVRQLEAAGALVLAEADDDSDLTEADVVLVVHPPYCPECGASAGCAVDHASWAGTPPESWDWEGAERTATQVTTLLAAGHRVALADVAQPNGADPALMGTLLPVLDWSTLDGYGAWNTAGNTLGTVVAQLVVTHLGRVAGTFDASAHRVAIARRVVEDYGWMSLVRHKARLELGSDPSRHDAVSGEHPAAPAWERELADVLVASAGLDGLVVVPGSLSFPWDRTFEIDLVIVDQTTTAAATATAPATAAATGLAR